MSKCAEILGMGHSHSFRMLPSVHFVVLDVYMSVVGKFSDSSVRVNVIRARVLQLA